MKLFFTNIFLLFLTSLMARPYNGEVVPFTQPDGMQVEVKLFGTEFYMRGESLDGYTLMRAQDGWIYYADVNKDKSQLIPTTIVYTGHSSRPNSLKKISDLPKHLDISTTAREQVIARNTKATGYDKLMENVAVSLRSPQDIDTLQGHVKAITILIDFPDFPATVPLADIDSMMNGANFTKDNNNGSIRKFYSDISGGLLDYTNVVFGYYHAKKSFFHYDDSLDYAVGAQQLLGEALRWIDSIGFDFSTLTTEGKGNNKTIKAINVMYTGNPDQWAKGLWFHAGYYGNFTADGVSSGPYNTSPANGPLTIGTVCHENGHMIGRWPDTYKYDSEHGPDGIGNFDLMCSGGPANNPVPPNPYFTARVGWGKLIDMTDYKGLVHDTAGSNTVYMYRNKNAPTEYYVFQSNQKLGRKKSLPDDGLTIWHVNELGDNQTFDHEIYLVHANNNIEDHSHACFRENYVDQFMPFTTPSSNFYKKPSQLYIWNISRTNPVMTYILGLGDYAPYVRTTYLGWDNDDNQDGFLTGGEQFNVNIRIANLATAPSDSVWVNIRPKGSNGQYIQVLDNKFVLPTVAGKDSIDIPVRVKIAAEMAAFQPFTLEFTIVDSINTQKFERGFTTGKLINMSDEQQITDCGYVYLDPGGEGYYANNSLYIQTLYPAEPNSQLKIKFSEFSLESSIGCVKDNLEILNGDEFAPSLGVYCGTNRPPVTTSSNPQGALTFIFQADGENPGKGWRAEIECVPTNSTHKTELTNLTVYPNPTSGRLNLVVDYSRDIRVEMDDLAGNQILNKHFDGSLITLNLQEVPKGVYILRVSSQNKTSVRRVVIQ
jgi:M6 family metalloprotease-like protein